MKTLKSLKKIFVIAFIALAAYSCSDDDNNEVQESIYEIAANDPNGNYNTFVSFLDRAELAELKGMLDGTASGSVKYTVFLPSESAFADFLVQHGYNPGNLQSVPTNFIGPILRNHIIEGEVLSSTTLLGNGLGYHSTMAQEQTSGDSHNISLFYYNNNGALEINGASSVVTADYKASNGIAHVVDAVLDIPTMLTFLQADPTFDRFQEAIGLIDAANGDNSYSTGYAQFGGPAPFTILAPNSAAFDAVLAELGAVNLSDITPSDLEIMLNVHVVADNNYLSSDLMDGMVIGTQAGNITINVAGSAITATDQNNRTANVIQTNIQSGNGVIHILDMVLLPL